MMAHAGQQGCSQPVRSNSVQKILDGKAIPASIQYYWYMDEARAEHIGFWACQPITDIFSQVATLSGVPKIVLTAISMNESSRNGIPWPWTLNIKGRAFYFQTREDAYAAIKALLAHHIDMFDVGIMQVNWKYNGWRFKNAWEALQPSINIAIAANILNENHQKTGNWAKAVALYHSANPVMDHRYLQDFVTHMRLVVAER